MEETPLIVEAIPDTVPNTPVPAPQPAPSILDDEAAVRAAVDGAMAKGIDPEKLTIGDLSQESKPAPAQVPVVPEKFIKPTGEVDVEKLKASTRQLDEEQKAKEAKIADIQKSIEDYLAAEKKFRNTPNPQKVEQALVAQIQPATAPLGQPMVPIQDMKARIAEDLNKDPVGTLTDLIDIIVAAKTKPMVQDIEQVRLDRLDNQRRENLKAIAAKDPRILDQRVFDAVNAKLQANPELWNLKNPHKAAWLEVKEEMRLGELTPAQAQPSKNPSPILGGGTPPPPQSSASGLPTSEIFRQAISKANFKDKVQAEALDKAAKAFFDSTMA